MLLPSASAVAEPWLNSAAQAWASAMGPIRLAQAIRYADFQRFLRIYFAPAEDQFLRPREADPSRQKVHAAAVGNQPAFDVAPCEARFLRREDKVARERHIGTQARRCAVDCRDGRFGHRVKQIDRVMNELLTRPAIERNLAGGCFHALRHAADVAACAESLPLPVNTTARTSRSLDTVSSATISSARISLVTALRFSGRFSAIVAICDSISDLNCGCAHACLDG